MTKETYMEKTKNDTIEMAQVLKKIPESKKESLLIMRSGAEMLKSRDAIEPREPEKEVV